MRCEYAFLCDFAQESGGKLNALGIGWSAIQTSSVPVLHQHMSFAACLVGTVAEAGPKKVEFRLIDADGVDIIPPVTAELELVVKEPALEGRMNITANLNGITFPRFGQYAIHLVVQGNEMARAPFSLVEPVTTT